MSHHVYCPEAAAGSAEPLWAEHEHHFESDAYDYVLVAADLSCVELTIVDRDEYYTRGGEDLLTLRERRSLRDDALYGMGWWRVTRWSRDVTTGRSTARVVAMHWRAQSR